jgi:hypothetical protein
MSIDPVKEWQRLSKLYAEKSDQELAELSASFHELTEIAQQVLQDELKRRGLSSPGELAQPPLIENQDAIQDNFELEETPLPESEMEEVPWILHESGDAQILGELQEALNQAGISSRIVNPQENIYRSRFLQLQVAERDALRSEQILAQPRELKPSPPKIDEGDFETPSCPKCGASDPLLESVEPFNTWLCENCGTHWTESGELDP